MEKDIGKEIDSLIDKYSEDIVKSTQELVKIKSVETESSPGKPFGEGVNEALNKALNMAENLGFETENIDGYAGAAEMGKGEEMMGILCHLDVVPEGSDWTYPPYAAEIHDNKIFGRGTIDDKGPAVAALYAMKAIKESDIELNKRVRMIFGTDEESGWEGMDYYLQREEIPDFAFSPDAQFPVIHAEKGILIFNLESSFEKIKDNSNLKVKSIKGGNAPNMVPDYCEAVLEAESLDDLESEINEFCDNNDYNIEIKRNGREIVLKSYGVSAHGSRPQDGHNAISQLMVLLAELDLPEDDAKQFIDFYSKKIGMEYYGKSMGCGFEDDVSGKLIFNVGMLDMDETGGKIVVNIRYPVTMEAKDVFSGIDKELNGSKIVINKGEHKEPLFVEKDDPLVKNLMAVYRDVTGDESQPIAIGGGTYARAVDKAVAFGPLFPGQPELAHQKDEFIAIDDLIKNAKIYARAIAALAGKN